MEHVELLDKNKFGKIAASVGFIKKKFITMHGHVNIKLGLEVKQSTVGVVSLIMLHPFLLPSMSLDGLQRFFTCWQCL